MICRTYPVNELGDYKYVIILSEYRGKILLSRHKERTTWEAQGGHIEPGETPLAAAKRELYEESGALSYEIKPLCDYWAGEEDGAGAGGVVFTAEILQLGAMPESEIAEVRQFDCLPENVTYPGITPILFAKKAEQGSGCRSSDGVKSVRFIYGTKNPAKRAAMQRRLIPLGIELVGLDEIEAEIPEAEENGATPLENAVKKARCYYEVLRMPVFSCDSGLYFDGIPNELQPGTHVRRVGGQVLDDDAMVQYYSGLAKRYGGILRARYRNAICLVTDEQHTYSAMEKGMESEPFYLVSTPHPKRNPGFPLDCISVDICSGKYYYDLADGELDQVAVEDGFLEFFKKVLEDQRNGRE